MKKINSFLAFLLFIGIGWSKAQFIDLHDFNGTQGSAPHGNLTLFGNKLYGMATSGGAFNEGCFFSLNKDGSGYIDLLDFNIPSEAVPWGSLILSGKKLFGMTERGGSTTSGSIFSIDTDGNNFKSLANFGGNAYPEGSLILSGGILYGMATRGGTNNTGYVFSIDTNGLGFQFLYTFNGTEGTYPYGALAISGNTLFGMTESGSGSYSDGVVFSIHIDGSNFKNIHIFNGSNGAYAYGSLTVTGGKLYGMTYGGGSSNVGCIFSLDTNGSDYKDLLDFNYTNGYNPYGSLILSGNKLYGMTYEASVQYGNIFSIDTSGSGFVNIFNFNDTDGAYPYGDLTLSGGVLYGMTTAGGANNDGVIFSYDVCSLLNSTPYMVNATSGCNGIAAVTMNGGNTPYSYLWMPGNLTTDTIKGQCAGTYTCTIQDNNGCVVTDTIKISSGAGLQKIKSENSINVISPNPTNGTFSLLSVPGCKEFEIFDVFGKMIYAQQRPGLREVISLNNQPSGVYFYRLISDYGLTIATGKFVLLK